MMATLVLRFRGVIAGAAMFSACGNNSTDIAVRSLPKTSLSFSDFVSRCQAWSDNVRCVFETIAQQDCEGCFDPPLLQLPTFVGGSLDSAWSTYRQQLTSRMTDDDIRAMIRSQEYDEVCFHHDHGPSAILRNYFEDADYCVRGFRDQTTVLAPSVPGLRIRYAVSLSVARNPSQYREPSWQELAPYRSMIGGLHKSITQISCVALGGKYAGEACDLRH